jgi:multiple sugar transport system substrate-binding protein
VSFALLLLGGCAPPHRAGSPGVTAPSVTEVAMQESLARAKSFRVAVRQFGPFEASIRREWESFRQQNGSDLHLELVAMDHHPLYHNLFEEGKLKDDDWDVAFIATDWLAEAHQAGSLADLAPYIAKDPPEDYPEGWTPSLLRLQQFDRQVLGLPYHDGPECLIYRTDLFDSAMLKQVHWAKFGTELKPPETWGDFARLAQFLKRPEDFLYGTVFAAYPDGHNTVYDICLQLWTRGGELFDKEGKMRLDTPEMIEALGFYRSLFHQPSVVHPKAREFDSVASGDAFLRGEAVMMINWFGFAAVCETSKDSKVKGKVAIAPVPHAKGCKTASLNCYWLLGVPSGSPHRQLAYDFIRHAMSKTADKQRTLEGVIGCRKSTWSDKEVLEAIPFYRQMETLQETARELPRLTNWVELSGVIDRMALETINTDKPIATIAAEAQQRADGLQGK